MKEQYPDIPWTAIRELRDLLTHRGEKQLGNVEKARKRIQYLQLRIAQTPQLLEKIDSVLAQEMNSEHKEEVRYVRRGLRCGIALYVLSASNDEKIRVGRNDPTSGAAARLMECESENLLPIIAAGAGRSVLVEIGDYLKASSLFC